MTANPANRPTSFWRRFSSRVEAPPFVRLSRPSRCAPRLALPALTSRSPAPPAYAVGSVRSSRTATAEQQNGNSNSDTDQMHLGGPGSRTGPLRALTEASNRPLGSPVHLVCLGVVRLGVVRSASLAAPWWQITLRQPSTTSSSTTTVYGPTTSPCGSTCGCLSGCTCRD